MPLTDPLPSLEEILDSIGIGGRRLAAIDATEGGAGNISVCIGWPIEVRRQLVDMIESAERSAPYCLCGAHMLAVADEGGAVWLECSERGRERSALGAAFARLTGWSHTRHMIMEQPGQ